jgi:TolB protein
MVNPDGSGLIRLTSESTEEHSPAWSPDGGRIAFTSERDGQNEIT